MIKEVALYEEQHPQKVSLPFITHETWKTYSYFERKIRVRDELISKGLL